MGHLLDCFTERAERQPLTDEAELEECLRSVRNRVDDLLSSWCAIVEDYQAASAQVKYQKYEVGSGKPLLREMLDQGLRVRESPKIPRRQINARCGAGSESLLAGFARYKWR